MSTTILNTLIRIKRGQTEALRLSYTPELGEPIWAVETNMLYIGDGTTVGGVLIGNSAELEAAIAQLQAELAQEISDRIDGDTNLFNLINAEQAARIAGDDSLQDNIDAETTAREAADTAINDRIDTINIDLETIADALATEITAREAGDTALGVRIDGVQSDLSDETANRIAADLLLQGNITAEETTRTNADNALSGRIDSEEEARADGDAALAQAILNEVSDREAADETLQDNIDAEALDRTNADTALGARIDSADTAISNETAARIAADGVLQDNIDAEALARGNADSALSGRIDDEEDARAAADVTLQTNINTEASTRANADTALSNRIDNVDGAITGIIEDLTDEIADREAADTALGLRIDDEIIARTAADSTLQTNINNEASARSSADTALGVRIDGVESDLDDEVVARTAADTALGVRIDDLTDEVDLKANSADLATVATTGSYNDLVDKPSIVGQVNADWNATSGVEEILNKPTTLSGYGITDAINVSQKGANNGVATLDSTGKIPTIQLPPIAISDTFVVDSEVEQLALTVERGDIAVRTDLSKSFINSTGDNTSMADWTELLSPPNAVLSVNGQTGAVVLDKGDVGLGNVDNTSDADKPISTATQTALDGKQNTFSNQMANVVFAGPGSGGAAAPAFRSLLASDIPNLSLLYAPVIRTVSTGTGLTGGGDLSANRTISLSTGSIASLAKADSAVQTLVEGTGISIDDTDPNNPIISATATAPAWGSITGTLADQTDLQSALDAKADAAWVDGELNSINTALSGKANNTTTVSAGTGLTGGGNLSANRTISLSAGSQASLALADTAVQPGSLAPVATAGTFASLTSKPTTLSGYGITDAVPSNRTLTAGTGIATIGDLSTNRTVALSAGSIASLALADSALQSAAIGSTVQAYDAGLQSISGLTTGANTGIYTTASDTYATYSLTAGGRALGGVAGTSGTYPYFSSANTVTLGTISANSISLLAAANYAAMRTLLGLVIGTNVQAYSANLDTWSGLAATSKANSAITLTAGNGLTGGGDLSANRSFVLGTPSTLTNATTNAVTSTSHTHEITGFLPTTGGTLTGTLNGTDLVLSGTGVGRMVSVTANATGNLTSTVLNRIVKKTNTNAYTYNIPASLGADDDTITVVNAGSAGDITVAGTGGVTIYSGGTAGSVTVGAYSTRTFVRVSSTIWVA